MARTNSAAARPVTTERGLEAERGMGALELFRAAESLRQSAPTAVAAALSVQALYAEWVAHNSNHPMLYSILYNQAVTLTDAGNLHAAGEGFRRAIALQPDFMPAHINLGRIYERLGAAGLAVKQWSTMLETLASVNGAAIAHKRTALIQSARVLQSAGQDEHAERLLRQTLEIDRNQREAIQHFIAIRQRLCEWPVIEPWEWVDRETLMGGISPLSTAVHTDDPMLQLAVSWNYNKIDVGMPAAPIQSHWAARRSGPLRIGYLSSDLREHAVGHLMAEVLALHDRDAVEIFAYYCGPETGDAMQDGFRSSVDHWVPISAMDDAAAARRIADDGIQILVDVNGYTRDGRTRLLALRPAPVIVNWLGFPGSMASPYHHYIIADDWIVPPGHDIYYSEAVVRLPCYQPNNRKRVVSPSAPSRTAAGLPEDGTVYCCFNGSHKITRATFERWLQVLGRVPGSVLWLLTGTDATNARLRRHAAAHGIATDRVVFADRLPHADHLARYALADLFLDTAPYGAHTTASDALWMGVPVLTLDGRSFAARVCGSLVRSAGLPDFVCATAEEFVDRAVALGRDQRLLDAAHDTLVAGRDSCVLFDMPRLVRELEARYRQMWTACEQHKLPQPDLSGLDIYLQVGSDFDHDATEVQTIRDYRKWWEDRLAQRHRDRPIAADRRFWTRDVIARRCRQAG